MMMNNTSATEAPQDRRRQASRNWSASVRFGGGGLSRSITTSLDRFDLSDATAPSDANVSVVKRHIKRLSGLVADPLELQLDERRIQNAVNEAGECMFGIDGISVWMLDEDSGKLVHSPGGWWRSNSMGGGGSERGVALAKLEDSSHDGYVPPKPVSPGTDIAGILWAESTGSKSAAVRRSTSRRNLLTRQQALHRLETSEDAPTSNRVRWRDIKSMTQDPDSATGPRLQLIEEAGFTMASGIPFQSTQHRGMVVVLTTVQYRNDETLTSITNDTFLYQAAQSIGATLSMTELRRASLAERYNLNEKCYNMQACGRSPLLVEEGGDQCEANDATTGEQRGAWSYCHIPPQVATWSRKLRGGSMQIPPPLSWRQTLWTILGSFVGLLLLSALNEYYRLLSDDEYFLLIGPFGAMCTLMYGLSAAPASQPRNAVMGQAIAGAVSLAFTYIPTEILPVWLRTAVGPACAIGAMVKLGVVHPPAGAHSVLYASGKYNFGFYGLVVMSTAISVIPATIVNNMSSKRQYPTYWGIELFSETLSRIQHYLFDCIGSRQQNQDTKTGLSKRSTSPQA